MRHKAWWMLAVLLILADAGITYWAVTGGHAKEANPNVKSLMEEHGVAEALAGAAIIRIGSLGVGIIAQSVLPKWEWTMPVIGVVLQVPPVVWNVWILFL